jgi:hypothetical protein
MPDIVKKQVLLLIDGHSTHVTVKASDICQQSRIELYSLLPHALHVMQNEILQSIQKGMGGKHDYGYSSQGVSRSRAFSSEFQCSDIINQDFQSVTTLNEPSYR